MDALHFAFYTLLHPMGQIVPSGLMKTQEWMVLEFTFYIVLYFHALLSTDWVSFNFHKLKLLHFAFYTLLQPMCHNCSIRFIEDSSVNDFTFYISHHAIHLAAFHGSQLFHKIKLWLENEWVYILTFYIVLPCHELLSIY